ncbi:MAG TPA: methylated-DNA--[protein]-cysteine S-methyltransferase [Solirubrobacteraceae bacterium]|nr:methylated-DNA--[protein]-cysteine S-methyltransferase [Solirubrobacteraceae bacterium]
MTDEDALERALRPGPPQADARPPEIAAQAAREGLADVVYATLDGPVGRLVLAASPRGLVRIAYADEGEEPVLAELAARVSPRVLADARPLDRARRELDEYFSGRRQRFELDLDRRLLGPFADRVLTATAAIPYGATVTYREVAGAAGSPRGFRAAGNALGSNPLPIVLPCHRVIASGGGLGGYTGGLERKRMLLAIEAGHAG